MMMKEERREFKRRDTGRWDSAQEKKSNLTLHIPFHSHSISTPKTRKRKKRWKKRLADSNCLLSTMTVFHLSHCAAQCAAPKLFKLLKWVCPSKSLLIPPPRILQHRGLGWSCTTYIPIPYDLIYFTGVLRLISLGQYIQTKKRKENIKKKREVGINRRHGAVVRNVYYVYLITPIRRGRGGVWGIKGGSKIFPPILHIHYCPIQYNYCAVFKTLSFY